MKIALPVWNDRLSTVLDTAGSVLLIDIKGHTISKRTGFDFHSTEVLKKVIDLADADVQMIICDALSREMSELLQMHGISVLQGRSGTIDDVISAHLELHTTSSLKKHEEQIV